MHHCAHLNSQYTSLCVSTINEYTSLYVFVTFIMRHYAVYAVMNIRQYTYFLIQIYMRHPTVQGVASTRHCAFLAMFLLI